jgi:phage gp29-like protein
LFKRNGIKFWLIFTEKFAQPTVVGKFPGSANRAEQDKLLSAVRAVTADAGLIIPDGMLIELLEAARTGTSDYVTLHDRMDAAINKVMLGHSASADATPGRLGGEDLAGEVRDDIIKADADRVCGSFNVGPARWLTFWNFGENVPPPKVWRRVQPEPDLKAQAERDQILYNIGFEPTDGYIKETYGDGFQRRADNTSQGDAAQPGQGAAQPGGADPGDLSTTFADAADAQSLIDAQGESDPGFQDATEQLLEPVLSALAEGLTPDEILGKLGDWYPQMNDAALQEILQRGIAAADAIGRLEVQNED